MNIQEIAKKYNDYLIEMRRYFHMYPEISCKEYNTSKKIKRELEKMGISWRACGLETGVLATIRGEKPGRTILLRADMDALTVNETTDVPYTSLNEGVMHACGHDCHIAMLLTAAHILNDMKDDLCGTVKLAFQPAEEIAKGAQAMIDQGVLDGVDACFAIHVWTDVPAGLVSLEPGSRMASCDQFCIRIIGKGSHGAKPEDGIDAVVATAAMINNLQTIVSREISPMEPAVITVGSIQAGTRWNVVAEESRLEGTTRCFSKDVWEKFPQRMERVVKNTAETFRTCSDFSYERLVPPTINESKFTTLAQQSAKKILGEKCLAGYAATTAAEDFSVYLQKVPGAIALLGTGNVTCGAVWPNHSGNFCVDESQLINGAMLYAQVAIDFNTIK